MTKNLKHQMLALIREYIDCANYMCKILMDNYEIEETLLRSRRINLIPKEGRLDNVYFNFHGGGCYFEFENGRIDVDFGPDGRSDGFDLYRLRDFLQSTKHDEYTEIESEEIFKNEFESLIKVGEIINTGRYPNSHLFYLKSNII